MVALYEVGQKGRYPALRHSQHCCVMNRPWVSIMPGSFHVWESGRGLAAPIPILCRAVTKHPSCRRGRGLVRRYHRQLPPILEHLAHFERDFGSVNTIMSRAICPIPSTFRGLHMLWITGSAMSVYSTHECCRFRFRKPSTSTARFCQHGGRWRYEP